MDINPFDQFAGEFNAALPPAAQQPTGGQPMGGPPAIGAPMAGDQGALAPPQFNLAPQQSAPKQPVMNNGMMGQPMQQYGQPLQQQQQQGQMNPMGMMNQGMMNQQPTASQSMNNIMPPQQGMLMPSQSINQAGFNNSMGQSYDGALVPSNVQSNPYSLGGGGGTVVPMNGGGSVVPSGGGSVVPQQQQPLAYGQQLQQQNQMNPFGAPPPPPAATATQMNPYQPQQQQPVMDPFGAAPAPPQLAAAPQQQMVATTDPWSSGSVVPSQHPQPPQPAQIAADPWGAAPPAQQSSALVPSNAPNDDPFGIFGAPAPPAPSQQMNQSINNSNAGPPLNQSINSMPPQQQPDDPWAEMGFGSPTPQPQQPAPTSQLLDEGDLFDGGIGAAAARAQKEATAAASSSSSQPSAQPTPSKPPRTKGELPPGGEWYDAKIFTPTLGVMFFKPKELVDSLFLSTDKKTVEALEDRPVVAFIVEGSSARSAGVELGHVLLKVNGIDVKNPKEASRLIKEGPRPLPLLFYVPDTQIVVAEGEHMVKYNTKETSAPNSAKDWKPKYVVVGGIIAQPWMINMYRSKSEYDIAVIETQARRPISVKVKQFSLQGARIQNDWQGPQMVKYKNKLHPWKYIVILPVSRNPIKIASPNLSQLKPVHEGIRRVLNAQQSRSGGGGHHSAQPVRRDEYDGRGGGGGYNGRGGY